MSEIIFDLLKNIDSSYCEKIIQSKYTEKPTESTESTLSTESTIYRGFVRCIISEFDLLYNNIPSHEQKIYFKKRVIDICSEMDEQSHVKYHNYKFNESALKSARIQYTLQLYDKKVNYISSIYYLNEYYQQHFVICYKEKMYETSLKKWPRVYLHYESNNKVHMTNIRPDNYTGGIEKELYEYGIIENDISKTLKQSYKMPLLPIGKYKIDDVKKIAVENNISLLDGHKKKTKAILYDEVNIHLFNM